MLHTDESILNNDALKISLEWGPRRSIPFEMRLREVHPDVTAAQIKNLKALCKKVESAGWSSVVSFMKEHRNDERTATRAWREALLKQYPWLNTANIASLWTQGCYYAWHDGELQ